MRTTRTNSMRRTTALVLCTAAAALLTPAVARAQVFAFSKEDLIEATVKNPFDRFPDGRPKVPDALIERARGLSMEEIGVAGQGYRNQYVDGWQVLQPGKKMVGRAFTVQFMPARPDLDVVAAARAKGRGINGSQQPGRDRHAAARRRDRGGSVRQEGAGHDRRRQPLLLHHEAPPRRRGWWWTAPFAIWKAIATMDMPAYIRDTHPSAIGNVMLTGWNIPVRIGNATVMPGDLVVGDREGVYFIPPALVEEILDRADETHIHDEWTRKKFDEGKYKSSEIYGSPRDPELKKEYAGVLETASCGDPQKIGRATA